MVTVDEHAATAGETSRTAATSELNMVNNSLASTMVVLVQAVQKLQERQAQAPPSPQNHPINGFVKRNKEFIVMGGTSFTGEEGPIKTDKWLVHYRRNFWRIQLTDEQKVALAIHRLEGAALFSWEATYESLDTNVVVGKSLRKCLRRNTFLMMPSLK